MRQLFENIVKQAPNKCKYIFVVDNPLYAEYLMSEEFMAVSIVAPNEIGDYTIDEFEEFITNFTRVYVGDYFYLPICIKTRNAQLYEIFDARGCKYSRDAWKAFSKGADYFQQHMNELQAAAQGLIDRCEGRKPEKSTTENKEPRKTQAEALFELVERIDADFFQSDTGDLYAVIPVDNHRETWRLNGEDFRTWLYRLYHEGTGRICNSEAVGQVIAVLSAKARFEKRGKVTLSTRVAADEGTFWYDLTNPEWQSIKITPSGWGAVNNSPTLFARYQHQAAQVMPQPGGDIRKIFDYVNIKGEHTLFLAWLVSCFVPDIPHTMPIIFGEKGAAKSTTCALLKKLIDPSALDTMTLQNDPRTLAVNLSQHWFLPFDNVSFINEETSDTLCRAITGGGIQQRKLHTNAEDVIFTFKRCLAINGINNVATRPDLLDRAILLELERITESERREAAAVQSSFEADRAEILGGIMDTLVKAMEIFPTVKLEKLPRMADFTRWGYAIGEALGGLGQEFLDEYTANLESQNAEAIAADPVATLVCEWMRERTEWSGTVTDLYFALIRIAGNHGIATNTKGFPAKPNALSRWMRSIKSNLESVGIEYENSGHTRKGTIISLKQGKISSQSSHRHEPAKIQDFNSDDIQNISSPISSHTITRDDKQFQCDDKENISSREKACKIAVGDDRDDCDDKIDPFTEVYDASSIPKGEKQSEGKNQKEKDIPIQVNTTSENLPTYNKFIRRDFNSYTEPYEDEEDEPAWEVVRLPS